MYLVVGLAQSVPIRTSDLKSDIWPDDQHKSSPMAISVSWVEVCPFIMPNKKIFLNFSFNVLKFRTKLQVCSSHNSNNFPFLPCSTAYMRRKTPSCMGFAPLVFYGATLFGWSYDCWINGVEKFFELFSWTPQSPLICPPCSAHRVSTTRRHSPMWVVQVKIT